MCETTCLGCGKDMQHCVCKVYKPSDTRFIDYPDFCSGCGMRIKDCLCHSPDNWSIPPWESTTTPWPPYATVTYPPVGDTDIDDLYETLTSMRNRIDVLLELNEHNDLAHTIPTVLEDLYEDCQRLVEDYSIE